MPLVPFRTIMQQAEEGGYAVGYFESWNLESLLAVADAAEAARAPVVLGFSGVYLPHPGRRVADPLGTYASLGLEVGRGLSVPCCLLLRPVRRVLRPPPWRPCRPIRIRLEFHRIRQPPLSPCR